MINCQQLEATIRPSFQQLVHVFENMDQSAYMIACSTDKTGTMTTA